MRLSLEEFIDIFSDFPLLFLFLFFLNKLLVLLLNLVWKLFERKLAFNELIFAFKLLLLLFFFKLFLFPKKTLQSPFPEPLLISSLIPKF